MHAPSAVALDSPPPFDSLSARLPGSRPGRWHCTSPFSQPEFCPSVSLSTLNAALLSSLYTRRSCFAHSSYTCSFSKPPTFASLSSHTSSFLSHPPSPFCASLFNLRGPLYECFFSLHPSLHPVHVLISTSRRRIPLTCPVFGFSRPWRRLFMQSSLAAVSLVSCQVAAAAGACGALLYQF